MRRELLDILDHTVHRAPGGMYCGDSAEMQELVKLGLMASAPRASFVPDPYFRITDMGRTQLKLHAVALAKGVAPEDVRMASPESSYAGKVKSFSREMIAQFEANRSRGGYRDVLNPREAQAHAYKLMGLACDDLMRALSGEIPQDANQKRAILEASANVANCALMMADNAGALSA